MNIYLDFEATQFKDNIIAIGATCDYGDFDCLVKPPHGDKVNNFISKLTGITPEMAKTALSIEEAFFDLFFWVSEMISDPCALGDPPFYHVYGNMDKTFLQNSIKYINNETIHEFVENLSLSGIDDSIKVSKFFHTTAVGVYKGLRFFEPDAPEQDHDPLNDAIALSKLMKHIEDASPLVECPFEKNISQKSKSDTSRYLTITATHMKEKNAKVRQFNSFDAAFSWILHKIRKKSPDATTKSVKKHLQKALLNNDKYFNYKWKKVIEN